VIWQPASVGLSLPDDEIHVWRIFLNRFTESCPELWRLLSPLEKERARKFHFTRDRERFIVAHGCMRKILGSYLRVSGESLVFYLNSYGKPFLEAAYHLDFSLAHSGEIALLAVTRNKRIGVDIEQIRPLDDYASIAKHTFSKKESTTLLSLPEDLHLPAFFACWTRKEAFIKATGEGLSHPLDQFDVSVRPEVLEVDLNTGPDVEEAAPWSIQSLYPGNGYIGALAVNGQAWPVNTWHYNSPPIV
jgi:4'-phosphopantetheinyl transferase